MVYIQRMTAESFAVKFITLLYKLLLDITYVALLYPLYAYAGFDLHTDFLSVLTGGMCAIGVILLLPGQLQRVSDLLIYALAAIMVLPLTTYCTFGGGSKTLTMVAFLFYVVALTLVKLTPTVELPELPRTAADLIFLGMFVLLVVYIVFTSVYYLGFSVFNISFDFTGVYETRSVYKATTIPLSGYLYPWAGNAVFPAAMAYYLHRKRYGFVVAAAFASLMIYTVTGQKSTLFAIALTIGVYIALRFKSKLMWIALAVLGLTLVCTVVYYALDSIMPYSMFVRRLLILPAKITDEYHAVFSEFPKLRLSHSILSGVFPYPFATDPAELIGGLFYNEGETHANTGILGDGFMNFGYVGMLVWSVLFAFLLKVADCLSCKKNLAVCGACVAPFMILLSNCALFTVFSTHGLMITFLLILLFPKEPDSAELPSLRCG